jgi:hypothetical protein
MVNIAFIVGKDADVDSYPIKYNSKKAPKWLKQESKFFIEFANKEKYFPSDVAMTMYLAHKHPNDYINCFYGRTVTTSDLNEFDVIFVIYDPIEILHCGGVKETCPKERVSFESMLKRTKATVYPYPEYHKYIINKPNYYKDLKRANIPVASFVKVFPKGVIKSPKRFKDKILKKGWEGIIIKPSYGGYSIGIKVFKHLKNTKLSTIKTHFQKLEKLGFPNATVQQFVPEFTNHYEFRTYWINEKYYRTIGTGFGDYDETFVSEGGAVPNSVKNQLKRIGKDVLQAIRQYPYVHPMIRIDFGCCIETDSCDGTYFVNEVETMACNILADEDDDIIEKIADASYTFAKSIKGKHIVGEQSDFISNYKPCVTY